VRYSSRKPRAASREPRVALCSLSRPRYSRLENRPRDFAVHPARILEQKRDCSQSTASIIVVVVVNMSVRNQLSDYELREFFRSLQDLLALSLDANLSFDSAEFLSRFRESFECFVVESTRVPSFRKTTAF